MSLFLKIIILSCTVNCIILSFFLPFATADKHMTGVHFFRFSKKPTLWPDKKRNRLRGSRSVRGRARSLLATNKKGRSFKLLPLPVKVDQANDVHLWLAYMPCESVETVYASI